MTLSDIIVIIAVIGIILSAIWLCWEVGKAEEEDIGYEENPN